MESKPEAAMQMPQYRSHKKVWALKIKDAHPEGEGGSRIFFEDERWGSRLVSADFELRRKGPGGYFVIYEDGYQSWSPTEAFENGYTRIEG